MPSCRYWYQDHYVRRPGYWLREQPGWVWVPSHYTWTPRGYVFAEGHWDYSLDRRGVLFAPVYFPRPVYERAGFSYSPSIVIDTGMLQFSLFAYPRYSHYYFGDYYDDAYLRIGIYPRFWSERNDAWYDPFYKYDRWQNRRTEPRWEEHERHEYDLRRADKDLRPPRTYREMETRQAKLPEAQRRRPSDGAAAQHGRGRQGDPAEVRADQHQRHEGRSRRRRPACRSSAINATAGSPRRRGRRQSNHPRNAKAP